MGRFSHLIIDPARAQGDYSSAMPAAGPTKPASDTLLRLNANESPYGPSPKALAAMSAALDSSHWYPDDHCSELRTKLAKAHGVSPQQVLVANGTTSLLGVIGRTLLTAGRNAVTSACSFISYPMVTRATGAVLIEAPLRQRGYDLEAISAAVDANTRLIFIANPNNPTGTLLDRHALGRFLTAVPSHVVVVLDEAYYDYAQYFATVRGSEHFHSISHVGDESNLVVLRTFSKAHGLAGIRVGYGIGPAELMGYFARVQDTFAVSALAQEAALAAFDDTDHIRFAVENNAQQADWLITEISALGYEVNPTWANFLCVAVGQDAREFARRLRAEGMLIRPLGAWGDPASIRVTVGTAEQNQKFMRALKAVSTQSAPRR